MRQFAETPNDAADMDVDRSSPTAVATLDACLLHYGARLVSSSSAELNAIVYEALNHLLTCLGVDYAVLRLFDHTPHVLLPIRYFAVGDVREFVVPDNYDTQLPWYTTQIRLGHVISLPHGMDDLPVDARAEREYMVKFGIQSLLLIPIRIDDQSLASLTLGTRLRTCVWSTQDEQSLIAFAQILGGTLRRQAIEDALRSYQEQLQAIIETAHLDVWTLNLRHPSRSFMRASIATMAGQIPNHLPDVITLALKQIHPEDRTAVAELLERCIRGELESFVHSFRLHTDRQTYSWVEAKAFLVRNGQGDLVQIIGVTQDVSARKAIEDALEVQRQELMRQTRLMAQTEQLGQIGGWEWDLATNTGYWSPETYHLHDVRQAEFSPTVGKAIQFYTPESTPLITQALQHALATGEGFDLKLQLMTAAQRLIWVRATGRVEMQAGQAVRIYGSFQDITQQTEVEEQLYQAQKLEVVGQLAGGIAHDFNNLLTAINGLSELSEIYLQRVPTHPNVERVRHYLSEINRAGQRAGTLTRQLLAFSRRQLLHPRLIHLGQLVSDISSLLRQPLNDQIRLSTIIAPDLRQVMADPGQMEQILVNLIVNAADAMPNGGEITIELANVTLTFGEPEGAVGLVAGEYVALAVHDTGVGMPPEVLERIFEPFFTTKAVGKGTGLGLAMVYGIVKQSGGRITVESEVGSGTSFRLLFPSHGSTLPDR